MIEGEWQLDEHGCWNLRLGGAWVWLTKRPAYCDRGHWQANVEGIATIDPADSFPRYYMSLDVAKIEMMAWLEWRLECEARLL
jgi:hypothetical protein